MDSKTRVLTALNHQKPDRAPFNFWMDRRLMEQYEQKHNHRHWRVTAYGADVIETFPLLDWPRGKGIDQNGTFWQTEIYLKDFNDIDSIPLPDPNDPKVYELIEQDIREFPDTAVFLDVITPWGHIANMRSYELIYMDMVDYEEPFKLLTRRITDILKLIVEKACQQGVTAVYLMEDLATVNGLAFSPAMIKEFCLDYAKELADIAHSYDKPVLFHSDGAVMDLLPLLLEIGVDACNPLQPHLNDHRQFKEQFGNDLALYGGLDNCYVIPEGTPEDVRDHVLGIFNTIGKPDGALIFSSHDIPLATPPENIEMMVNTIKNECHYT